MKNNCFFVLRYSPCKLLSVIFILLIFLSLSPGYSQEIEAEIGTDEVRVLPREELISVFLDCSACDESFIKQELNFVNFARDPGLAEIHLFITHQETASGGRLFTVSFIGKKQFEGMDQNLTYTSLQTNTRQEEREGLNAILKVGFVPYISKTSLVDRISVDISAESVSPEKTPEEDPWNNWIFEIYGGLNYSEETSVRSLDIRYGVFADYVTEDWRIRLRPYFNYNQRDFVRNDEEIRSVLHRDGFQGRVVRSISDHWSIGGFTNVISNTYENIEFGYRIAPAIEYSLLPYELALRKEYTIAYSIGYLRRNYIEETIFNETEETLYNQSLELDVRVLEPWGSIRAGIEGSHFLHDFSKNRLSISGRLSVRVFKGLSVDFSSRYDYVQDQLSLPKGDASLEDVLLQQRQLATNYGISANIGLSYNFGSIYNNVVNTRL